MSFLKSVARATKSEEFIAFCDKYSNHIFLAKQLTDELLNLRKEPKRGISSYLKYFAASTYAISDFINQENSEFYFGDNWTRLTSHRDVGNFLLELLRSQECSKVTLSENLSSKVEKITIDKVDFAWDISTTSKMLRENYIYYDNKSGILGKEKEILEKLFWKKFPSQQVSMAPNEKVITDILSFSDDDNKDFIPYKLCNEMAQEIKAYSDNGYSHSVLFWGPVGTGKSNLMRGIAFHLGKKSIRFSRLLDLSSIYDCIKLFSPNVILFEDIDRFDSDAGNVLDYLERINRNNVTLLATANKINKMEDATIRPERFSEIKEIKILDPEVMFKLVEEDQELFKICKELPVVSAKEIMKRVKTFGKEKALKNIDDVILRAKKAASNKDYEFDAGNDNLISN